MKKVFLSLLLLTVYLLAIPAQPGIIEIVNGVQKIKVLLSGDEKVSYIRSLDGYTLLWNNDGILTYATQDENYNLIPSNVIANDIELRTNEEISFVSKLNKYLSYSQQQVALKKQIYSYNSIKLNKSFPSIGKHKLLMLLIDFPDIPAKISKSSFEALMNQYKYGGIGSFKDYYYDQSFGQLEITTDVYGWYTSKYTHDYYGKEENGKHDSKPYELVREAVDAAENAGVDFSQYDNNKDGILDAVMVIHAGYGQEAGGAPTTIWSHRWSLSAGGLSVTYDNTYINDYALQPELRGNSGTNITNIGVICHEFGHILGLPDWYDTDYSTNGQAFDLDQWDCMAGGSWNNGGKTPANHNSFSRWWEGWIQPTELKQAGNYSLKSMSKFPEFYVIRSNVKGEFFMLENRQKEMWDSALGGHGMLIYHVDSNYIASHWHSNDINAIPEHQGLDIEEADNLRSSSDLSGDPFPGTSNNRNFTDFTTPNSILWNKSYLSKPITNITENNKIITFDFLGGSKPLILFKNPAFNEIIKPNSQYKINFITYNTTNINLYLKNLKTNKTIIVNQNLNTSLGYFDWNVPNLPLSTYVLIASDANDTTLQFFSNPLIIYEQPKIFITEVADNPFFNADYVEIFNADNKSVNLNYFILEERFNKADNTNQRILRISSSIQKNPKADLILEPGEYAIFLNNSLKVTIDSFKTYFNVPDNVAIFSSKFMAPNIDGDERYQLKDSLGNIIDRFGLWTYTLSTSFRTDSTKCYTRAAGYLDGSLKTSWNIFDKYQYTFTPGYENIVTDNEYNNDKIIILKNDLQQNYPNPFNPTTTITFTLQQNSFVNIKIFNILGEQISELLNKEMQAGTYNLQFNAGNLSSGIYICQLKTNNFTKSIKMTLLK